MFYLIHFKKYQEFFPMLGLKQEIKARAKRGRYFFPHKLFSGEE